MFLNSMNRVLELTVSDVFDAIDGFLHVSLDTLDLFRGGTYGIVLPFWFFSGNKIQLPCNTGK